MSEEQPLIDQLWKLYKKIPKDLQEAIFSAETSDSVFDICENNNIEEVREIAKIVGDSLLGILPPKEIEETIKKRLNLSSEKAHKVALEIDRFILYPLKDSLLELYGEEAEEIAKSKIEVSSEEKEKKEKEKTKKKKKRKDVGKDSYREPIG